MRTTESNLPSFPRKRESILIAGVPDMKSGGPVMGRRREPEDSGICDATRRGCHARGFRDTRQRAASVTSDLAVHSEEDRNMKTKYLVAIALAAVASASATSAAAHAVDSNGKITVTCPSESVRMAAINRAVANSRYRATHPARRKMLSLAQQACARGAPGVIFVQPADEDACQTSPRWSTSCRDQAVTMRATPDSSTKTVP